MNKILATLLLSLSLIPNSHAWEPDKNKPIKLVMATTPGSSSDIVTRAIGKSLNDSGFQVSYEYKTGVGGILAANDVHESVKDGHTLLSVLATGMFVTPDLYYLGARKYEWDKFELVSMLSKNPSILIGKTSVEADTVPKMLSSLRSSKPERFSIGHGPGGGLAQVENFLAAAKYSKEKDIARIPYKGPKEAALDVAAESTDYAIVVMPSPYGLIEANKVKAIAVTSPKRLAKLPNVPTVSETIKGFSLTGINGVALPEGTNKEIVEFYIKHFTSYMKGKEYQTILDNAFLTLDNDEMGPTAFKNAVKETIQDTLPVLIKSADNQKKK
jgi:tripartite-type tricarboxylate transporter receptor subunit TctC